LERSTGTTSAKRCQPSAGTADYDQISEKLHKKFNVLKLIEGRTRGHLFTKQIRETEGF
jgi:hypothetical protein